MEVIRANLANASPGDVRKYADREQKLAWRGSDEPASER